MKALLEACANPEYVGNGVKPPLISAMELGDGEIVKLLVEYINAG